MLGLECLLLNLNFSQHKYQLRVAIYGAGEAGAQLSAALRLAGNHRIVTFLDEEPSNELSPEWKAEIDKRIADIDSGKTVMHDGEDVFKELTQKYK